MLMLVIAVALTGVIATTSYADEAAPSPTAAATTPSAEDVSANIVDTQNLLGTTLARSRTPSKRPTNVPV